MKRCVWLCRSDDQTYLVKQKVSVYALQGEYAYLCAFKHFIFGSLKNPPLLNQAFFILQLLLEELSNTFLWFWPKKSRGGELKDSRRLFELG